MTDLTLNREELMNLTGKKQPKRMAEWLSSRGWIFEPPSGRSGLPKVDRAYYLARMSGQRPAPRRIAPELDFMLNPS